MKRKKWFKVKGKNPFSQWFIVSCGNFRGRNDYSEYQKELEVGGKNQIRDKIGVFYLEDL